MSVITRLRDFFHESIFPESIAIEGPPETEEHLTVAALLILVAQADGRLLGVEEEGLRVLLGSRFGLSREQAERLLRHAGEIEDARDASTTLVDRILHDLSVEERPRLLALAYRIAAIDGAIHEFEDDLIWRTGRLLNLSDGELAAIKADALKNLLPDQARG
jgi:uncharacterized tellurite resistance protein B-like protein